MQSVFMVIAMLEIQFFIACSHALPYSTLLPSQERGKPSYHPVPCPGELLLYCPPDFFSAYHSQIKPLRCVDKLAYAVNDSADGDMPVSVVTDCNAGSD